MGSSILLSLLIWLFEALTCYIVAIAVGARIPIIAVIFAVSIANVGKCAPATPGAVGIYECILVAILVLFETSFDIATVIAILDHLIKNLFILVIGVPATVNIGIENVPIYEMTGKYGG